MRVQFDGRFIADFEAEEVFRNGRVRRLQHKPFRLLELLLSRPRQLVKYQEIARFLWPDARIDTSHNLKEAAQKLRRALGARGRQLQCLRGRGYRLMVDITEPGETGLTKVLDTPGTPVPMLPPAGAESVAQPAPPWPEVHFRA